jgi:hypothetical protein
VDTREIQPNSTEQDWIAKYRAATNATIKQPRTAKVREVFNKFSGVAVAGACKVVDELIRAQSSGLSTLLLVRSALNQGHQTPTRKRPEAFAVGEAPSKRAG